MTSSKSNDLDLVGRRVATPLFCYSAAESPSFPWASGRIEGKPCAEPVLGRTDPFKVTTCPIAEEGKDPRNQVGNGDALLVDAEIGQAGCEQCRYGGVVGIAEQGREADAVAKQVIPYLDGLDLVIGSGLGGVYHGTSVVLFLPPTG